MASLKGVLMPAAGGVVSLVGAGGKTSLMFRLARELSESGDSVLTTTTTKIFIPTKSQSKHVILSASSGDIIPKAKQLLKINQHLSAAKKKINTQSKLKGFSPDIIDELWRSKLFQWILVEADGAQQKPLKAPGRYEPVIPACSHIVIGVVGLDCVNKPLGEKWVFRPEVFAEITKLNLGESIDEASVAESILREEGIMKGSPLAATRIVFLNQADISNGLKIGRRIRDILIEQQSGQLNRIIIGNVRYDPPVLEYLDLI
ncbi:selenium cofactor biosynthesis protein YqeC [Thermodesulfobacteriota bacterium]